MRRPHRLPLEELQPYLFNDPAPRPIPGSPAAPPIIWKELFGDEAPVEIEVGFGKGLFLVTAATRCPEVRFFGIEIVRKYQLYAANRMAIRGLKNVRLACGDARSILRDRVQPSSVQAIHVYFPDPWWKKRHKKRRVFTPEFAASAERVLKPGGSLHIVTDVEEYFGVMTEIVAGLAGFQAVEAPKASEATHEDDYLTNFERKFRKQGKPIYRAAYQKWDSSQPTSQPT